MSFDALAWAGKCQPGSAPRKLVLLALADRHNPESNLSYPSIAWLTEWTGLNRKTIIAALDDMERTGLISDSGKRVGKTGQVKAYTLHIETVPKAEQFQKRNSTVFSAKQYQKRDTEPVKEPVDTLSSERVSKRAAKPKTAKPDVFPCPSGVDLIDWQALVANRKAKRAGLTEGAHRAIVKKLNGWARDGWPPGPIVANAAERGWTSVFETDEMKAPKNGTANRPGTGGQVRDTRDGMARYLDERIDADRRRTTGEAGGDCASPFTLIADNRTPAVRSDDANIFHLATPVKGRC